VNSTSLLSQHQNDCTTAAMRDLKTHFYSVWAVKPWSENGLSY